jgi:hypothetical protein
MVTLAAALLFGWLVQGVPGSVPKPAATVPAAGASLLDDFTKALDEKQWDTAEAQVVTLVAHYRLNVQTQKTLDPNGDRKSRDLIASAQRSRRAVAAAFERAVEDAHAAAKLQQSILGKFGAQPDEGEKLAVKALDMKHVNDVPASQAAAITALGSLRNPKYADLFERRLRDTHPEVVNAAAHALGEYFGEKEAERKRIVGILIFAYESADKEPSKNPQQAPQRTDADSKVVLDVGHEFQIALARLTGGVRFDHANLWSEWYRDARSTKWRDGVEKVSIPPDGTPPGPGH